MSLWGAYCLGHLAIEKIHPPQVFETGLYLYGFVISLNVFRALFAYGKWIFPKVELQLERSASGKHRGVWSSIIVGILGKAIYDLFKTLVP